MSREAKPAKASSKLLTLQQASDAYGPPYTTLRDLVINGALPAVRFPGTRRIWLRREDLEQLIAQSIDCGSNP